MNQEIEGKKVRVLPLMLEKVDPPSFLKGKLYADFTSDDRYANGLEMLVARLSENPNSEQTPSLSSSEVDSYLQLIEQLKAKLNVSEGENRLLLERLEKERRNIPETLKEEIRQENTSLPEFSDINKYYAFICSGINVTAGYVLHGLRKEAMKGGPHQLVLLCELNNQTDELALLVEAVLRRLKILKS